jgi:hypothetical protein
MTRHFNFALRILGLVIISCAFVEAIYPQQKNVTLSGYIKDSRTGEELIAATLFVKEIKAGTVSNNYGFYALSLPKGKYTLIASYLGYKTESLEIELNASQTITFQLEPDDQMITEVRVVADKKDQNVSNNEMSVNKLQMKTIAKIPALMGEVDVLRSIQLLPGVQTVGEGSVGFYVRGGSADQNLILLDEATIYNASHLGGLFSIFNQDVIKDVKLYKGGIPSPYGGRLSSILEVRMKEGNAKELQIAGGIGIISSRLAVEAPLIKNKASFSISGRRTYADVFFPLLKDSVIKNSRAYFYDFNLKGNYQINENNRIFVSGYFGRDVVRFGKSFQFDYGNRTFTLRYNRIFSNRIFANYSFIYSIFDYGIGIPDGNQGFDWQSGINDISLKNDYTLFLNPKNTIRFGGQVTQHEFRPGKIIPTGGSIFNKIELENNRALESGLFIENDQIITSRLSARYGLRLSMFQNIGPFTSYLFEKSGSRSYTVLDSVKYARNRFFNTQFGIEPRLSIKFELNNESSVKLSYNHMVQYLHLTTNTMSTTPLDIWFPSSPNVKPQNAHQYSVGYFRNFMSDLFESSIEVYYKQMGNSIDFSDHARLLLNKYLEGDLRFGSSYAYGLEIFLKKQSGKLTGWLSYTYSRVFRKIEGINSGKPYPAHYDKPNDFSAILSYDFTPELNFSVNWIYSAGAPRTMPTGRFEFEGMIVPVYSERNSVRLPDYHRMDAAITYHFRKTKRNGQKKPFNSSLNLSVYNVYNRHNAYSIIFNQSPDDPYRTEATKTYLFKVFPSLTYNFSFN